MTGPFRRAAPAAALLQADGTLITVALPAVAAGLHVSSASTSSVLSCYFAAYAVALLPGGALVDRFGARSVGLIGLGMFAVGAALGAMAYSISSLMVTRIVQGLGAGLVSPAALAGAVSGFPPARRGSALGVWGASAGIANLVGPVLGGLLTVGLGWRANWWVLLPLAALAAVGIACQLPGAVPERDGAVRWLINPAVLAAVVVAAVTFAIMIGSFFRAEQYLQRMLGYSALGASSVLVLVALVVAAVAPLSGRIVDRRGERPPAVAGFALMGGGLGALGLPAVSLHRATAIVPLIEVGAGLGMLFVPTSRAALNAVPHAALGRTSALLSMARMAGAAAGAGLAGLAIATGPNAATVHSALLMACTVCLLVGIPVAARLEARAWLVTSEPVSRR